MKQPGVSLAGERAALDDARRAVDDKLERFHNIKTGGGADAVADEYIDAVVRGAIEKMQQELVTFGRIDDDRPWRVGLYGIDRGGEQLVVDWRAPFASAYYQAGMNDPHGLARRVSYVGCIDDLFIEDFEAGEVAGSSPLLGELSKSKGSTMKAAVATLQSEQDELVRLPPDARLILRGGPGTGKTVVGLHRAAWLVYNDTRLTADRILVIGPSERFLKFVATVLPTLGELRVLQTTFDRLLGPSHAIGSDEAWLPILDRFEASLYAPGPIEANRRKIPGDLVEELLVRYRDNRLPWRDRRKLFVRALATRTNLPIGVVSTAAKDVWPSVSTKQAWARLRRRATLEGLGIDELTENPTFIHDWLALDNTPSMPADGSLYDEVRARFEGTPAKYSHVIVDEAQDLSLLQTRSVERRGEGFTLVGDDAQRSNPVGIGLARACELLDGQMATLDTAYRMSAEIADWLNMHARRAGIDAVHLNGIRPTGTEVRERAPGVTVSSAAAEAEAEWNNVAVIAKGEVWDHKGVEYDAVIVDTQDMDDRELYLAASRAAHQLTIV